MYITYGWDQHRLPKAAESSKLRRQKEISLYGDNTPCLGMTHLAMMPTRFLSSSIWWGLRSRLLFREHLNVFECHILRFIKSLIYVHRYTLGVKQENFICHQTWYICKNQQRDRWKYSVKHSSIQVVLGLGKPKALSSSILGITP